MSVLATAARFIALYGQAATLKRTGSTNISLKAKRLTAQQIIELGNTSAQIGGAVKIGTAELAASDWSVKAPLRTDQLVLDGRTVSVLAVRPVKEGDTTSLYVLELAG